MKIGQIASVADASSAHVYLGNGGHGRGLRAMQQRRSDGSARGLAQPKPVRSGSWAGRCNLRIGPPPPPGSPPGMPRKIKK